jgi:hypothetical protein
MARELLNLSIDWLNRPFSASIHEGLRSNREDAGIHHIIGVILGTQGKLDVSIEQFTEALRIKPATRMSTSVWVWR